MPTMRIMKQIDLGGKSSGRLGTIGSRLFSLCASRSHSPVEIGLPFVMFCSTADATEDTDRRRYTYDRADNRVDE